MSQELWLDRKRRERDTGFAPPTNYDHRAGTSTSHKRLRDEGNASSSRSNLSHYRTAAEEAEDSRQRQYNHQETRQRDIINECDAAHGTAGKKYESSSIFDDVIIPNRNIPQRKGAQIAPPASFEYYAPNSKNRSQGPGSDVMKNLENAISKGLKKMKDDT